MRTRLLVFDLDGTLIDSEQDLANAVNATLAHLDRPALPTATIRGYIGDGAATLLRRALGEASGDRDLEVALDFFLAYYRAHKLDNTRLYPGVREMLDQLRTALPGVLMAVLTNKPLRPSREICSGLGIAPFFFQIYGGESFAWKKPDPVGLFALLHEASARYEAIGKPVLDPAEAVMIGDSPVDIATASAARTRSLGCTFGLNEMSVLRAAHPTYLAASPSEWLAVLAPDYVPATR